jgi:hypothetical protein
MPNQAGTTLPKLGTEALIYYKVLGAGRRATLAGQPKGDGRIEN